MQQTVFNIIFSLLLVLAICQQNPAPQPYKAPEAPWGSPQPFLPFRPSPQSASESPDEEPAPARNPNPVPQQRVPQQQAPETPEPQTSSRPAPYKAPEAPWGSPQPFIPFRPSPQQQNPQPTPREAPETARVPQPEPQTSSRPAPYKAPEAPWGSPQPFVPFRPSPQPDSENQPNQQNQPEPAIVLIPVPQNSNDDSSLESQNQAQRITENAQKIKDQCDQFITPDEATTTVPQTNLHSNTITVTMTVTYGATGNQQTLAKICNTLRTALSQNSGRDFNDCVWTRASPLKRQAGAVWQGSTESPSLNTTETQTPSPAWNPEPDNGNENGNGAGSLFTSLLSIILIIGIGFLL